MVASDIYIYLEKIYYIFFSGHIHLFHIKIIKGDNTTITNPFHVVFGQTQMTGDCTQVFPLGQGFLLLSGQHAIPNNSPAGTWAIKE